jgi:hypothetical protein
VARATPERRKSEESGEPRSGSERYPRSRANGPTQIVSAGGTVEADPAYRPTKET